MTERVINQFMRRQAVAYELGVSRHTIARLLLSDATFLRFVQITPGIEVIARADFDGWLRKKRLKAYTKPK